MDLNLIALLSILVIWLIYQLIVVLFARDREYYNLIICLVFIGSFTVFYFSDGMESREYEYTYYLMIGYIFLTYVTKGLTKHFKREISDQDFYNMEKKLEEINVTSELLRQRFISTIEIMNDGICFRDSDGTIFGSDKYIEYLGISDNGFTIDEFENVIYKDDLIHYKSVLEKATKKNPVYKVDYRVKNGEDFTWIKEVGKRIILEKKVSFISIVKRMDIKEFPESEIDVLNGLPNYKKMYDELQRLSKKRSPYNLVMIQLTNIPKINDKYGRDVGDLMMGEYLNKIKYNFLRDDLSLFRISGITFGLLIKDEKKFEFLERALTGGGELMNLNMVFGGITQTLYPNLGIAEAPYEGKSPDKMIDEALAALNISLKDTSNTNYCFYDRI